MYTSFIKKELLDIKIKPVHVFTISIIIVNAGNYLLNVLLGNILGPELFADTAVLITLLLILSFIGMAFQVATAKFIILLDISRKTALTKLAVKYALILGLIASTLLIVLSKELHIIFQTQSQGMFIIFAIGIPFYFFMCINRGFYLGEKKLVLLSLTYHSEMLSRLIFTLLLVVLLPKSYSTIAVAIGILISLVIGLFPIKNNYISSNWLKSTSYLNPTKFRAFFMITAFYECTQILINHSDLLLVKHFFNNYDTGLYAALALIGRAVYYTAWIFIMLLLPKVIALKKQGKNTQKTLFKYVIYTSIIAAMLIICSKLFPNQIIVILFGKDYVAIAPLLWKYALASSLFAVANIFSYYFLSLNKYFPIVITSVIGVAQIISITLLHSSLNQIVVIQILLMIVLLLFQALYFIYQQD